MSVELSMALITMLFFSPDLIFRCYIEVIYLAYAQYHGTDSKDLLIGVYYLI